MVEYAPEQDSIAALFRHLCAVMLAEDHHHVRPARNGLPDVGEQAFINLRGVDDARRPNGIGKERGIPAFPGPDVGDRESGCECQGLRNVRRFFIEARPLPGPRGNAG